MNRFRMCSSIVAFSLAILFPFCANAAPANRCRQLQRDLDRQIDDLKESQKSDLQQCRNTSGRNSGECRLLQDQQNQELSSRRADRAGRMAACRRPVNLSMVSSFDQSGSDFSRSYLANRSACEYPQINCKPTDYWVGKPHHHRHPRHEPGAQPKGAASASNGGGNSASGNGSAGHSGSSSSGSMPSGSSAGGYSGGSASHSGYTGSSGGSSGSTFSSGGSSSSGGAGGAGGSVGSGSHDSGGGRRSN